MNMRNGLFTMSAVALAALLTACGGEEVKQAAPDCVFPDAPNTPAPGWICDEPVEGVEVSAVGVAEKSAAGHSFMKNMASTDARVQLAQSMKVHVQNMVKQYAETTGAASTETVDKVNTSVTKQITDQTLVGTKVFLWIIALFGIKIRMQVAKIENVILATLEWEVSSHPAQEGQLLGETGLQDGRLGVSGNLLHHELGEARHQNHCQKQNGEQDLEPGGNSLHELFLCRCQVV